MESPWLWSDSTGALLVGELLRTGTTARIVSARAATAEGDAPEESGHAAIWNDRDRPGTAPRGGGLAFVGVSDGAGPGIAAGVNAAGIHAAATPGLEPSADIGLMTRRILEQAADPAAAAALAMAELREARRPGASIHVAGPGRAVFLTLAGRDVRVEDIPAGLPRAAGAAWPETVLDRLAAAASADDPAGAVVAGVAARVDRRPEVLICLGPWHCGVPIRHWPGIDVAPQSVELGQLTTRLAAVVRTRPALQAEVDRLLVDVRTAVLAEGEMAERLASIMDRDGDDRGAEVRRGVAQFHALELAIEAVRGVLERLEPLGGAAGPPEQAHL